MRKMDLFGKRTIKALNAALEKVCSENVRLKKANKELAAVVWENTMLCEKCYYYGRNGCTQPEDVNCMDCKEKCICGRCENGSNFVWEGD